MEQARRRVTLCTQPSHKRNEAAALWPLPFCFASRLPLWQSRAPAHTILRMVCAKPEREERQMEKIERMHWLYGIDKGRRC